MSDFDINDLIVQDQYEATDLFLVRKAITLKIATLDDYPMNPMSAIVTGRLLCNKVKLGLTYDEHVEELLTALSNKIANL